MSESLEYWRGRWQHGQTAWNLGRAHRLLPELQELAREYHRLPASGKVYVPGAGHAHDAVYWVQAGYDVVAEDFAPEAVEAARERYAAEPRLTLRDGDALVVAPSDEQRFAMIYDRAMLCALSPELRQTYVDACHARLAPGGVFAGVIFSALALEPSEGPPFALDLVELAALFAKGFTLIAAETRRDGHTTSVILGELLCIWQKRSIHSPNEE